MPAPIDLHKVKELISENIPDNDISLEKFGLAQSGSLQVNVLIKNPETIPPKRAGLSGQFINSHSVYSKFHLFMEKTPPSLHITRLYVNDGKAKHLRGLGIGKQLLKNAKSVADYVSITKLELTAVSMGSYFWARAGFTPKRNAELSMKNETGWETLCQQLLVDMEKIDMPTNERRALQQLLERSQDPKDIWVIADSKYGKELLNGKRYEAYLDLNDPDMVQRFEQHTALSKEQSRAIHTHLKQAQTGRS